MDTPGVIQPIALVGNEATVHATDPEPLALESSQEGITPSVRLSDGVRRPPDQSSLQR